jgi:cation/acetate symporter
MGQQETAEDVVADGGEEMATDGGRAVDDAVTGDDGTRDDAATEE